MLDINPYVQTRKGSEVLPISFRAAGLLSYLKENRWYLRETKRSLASKLSKVSPNEGRAAIKSALEELITSGHLEDWTNGPSKRRFSQSGTPGYVYLAISHNTGLVKIGCTSDVERRLPELEKKFSQSIEYLKYFWCSDMGYLESALHQWYEKKLVEKEWFRLSEQDVSEIPALASHLFQEVK